VLALAITALLLVLLAIRVPVGFALAISGAAGLYIIGGLPMVLGIMETEPLSVASSYEMITIPMFLLMAEFVIVSGVADDLFKAGSIWVGRVPGGLAISTALASAGFAAVAGSSTASAATLSSTSLPAMLRMGYEPKLACGVVAISGTLAMLIPPSIALVLYGIIADVNIGQLLIGGIIPGLIVTAAIALTVLFLVWLNPSHAPAGRAFTWRQKIRSLSNVWPMLVLFTAVTGAIYLGIATPTEAAAIGALGAYVVVLLKGKGGLKNTLHALARATETTCMVIMIILGAHFFGYFLTITQTTQQIVAAIGALPVDRWVIMSIVILIYLILGCFLDQIAILILTVPVALPIITSLGFDPVWFGVLVIVVGEVGMVTPPVGLNAFVVARYAERPLNEVFVGVAPHVVAHLLVIALFCLFPQLILWLPGMMVR
jgi:tripartite ATP-independent transporter DctM subunit